jgi:hypothetical protein
MAELPHGVEGRLSGGGQRTCFPWLDFRLDFSFRLTLAFHIILSSVGITVPLLGGMTQAFADDIAGYVLSRVVLRKKDQTVHHGGPIAGAGGYSAQYVFFAGELVRLAQEFQFGSLELGTVFLVISLENGGLKFKFTSVKSGSHDRFSESVAQIQTALNRLAAKGSAEII